MMCPVCRKPCMRRELIGDLNWYTHREVAISETRGSWGMCVDLSSISKNRQTRMVIR